MSGIPATYPIEFGCFAHIQLTDGEFLFGADDYNEDDALDDWSGMWREAIDIAISLARVDDVTPLVNEMGRRLGVLIETMYGPAVFYVLCSRTLTRRYIHFNLDLTYSDFDPDDLEDEEVVVLSADGSLTLTRL
jgi:hypothetical protein